MICRLETKLHAFLRVVRLFFYRTFCQQQEATSGFQLTNNIKLRKRESLKSYVSQFKIEALEKYNLDHTITMTIMKSGL